ncbi:5-formyltetrahydrofolate cyclo-ligase [Dyadobacter tibetensis]|uniref:5-formyltetrahydrofolate cyclo-ligase n=1 Tax=Dyadobacter tibetensis TaxID=1211851 RepID=UPI0004AE11D7|nr:5-formyltetrahydrofolate cyclo-ligase [Dyadobacter tibetensis]
MDSNITMNKAVLRTVFQKRRDALSHKEFEVLNKAIGDHVIGLLEKYTPKIIHTFISLPRSKEPDTTAIIREVRRFAPNTRIAAPYMIPGTKRLEHYFLEADSALIANKWGILEPDPAHSESVSVHDINFVLLPLLAFDEQGYRVGYGGGYYDRFLATCNPETKKIGISLFGPVKKIEDRNEFDIRMDYCITPKQCFAW